MIELDLDQRIEMSRLYEAGAPCGRGHGGIGRSASTVGRELRRNTLRARQRGGTVALTREATTCICFWPLCVPYILRSGGLMQQRQINP